MERQRQNPLPLILFYFTASGSTKRTRAFAFVSFIEPVQSDAHDICRIQNAIVMPIHGCCLLDHSCGRPIGRTSESLRQSPQTLVSSQCTDAGTNRHTNAIALLSLFVPVTELASVKRGANVVTISWSYPRENCQRLPTLDKYFCPEV